MKSLYYPVWWHAVLKADTHMCNDVFGTRNFDTFPSDVCRM